jgi:hypothetical protein
MQNSLRCVLPVMSTEQVAQQPVDQPWRRHLAARHLLEGDLQLIERIVPCLVDAREPGWWGR